MNKKSMISVLAAAAMLAALTGCGAQSQPAADSQSAAPTDSVAPAETEAAAESQEAAPDDDASPAETPADTPADEAVQIDFDYNLNGTKIVVGEEADPVIEKLGEADATFEAPSCAFTGVSYFYTYGGVQVITYPDEHDQSLNRIYEVDLNNDTAATNEGITVGSTYEDMIAKYGKPSQETPAYAMYETEGKAVRFFLTGNTVSQIVYTIVIN
ncbi:MAG: hypothetical protein IJL32_09580 [Oscillospiraceae bacterium]|nr:hypothetical protein [Oscillospiraceae bacterium]MBQ9905949.1 hypothetical protein [Oscillospiraceae bacterium]